MFKKGVATWMILALLVPYTCYGVRDQDDDNDTSIALVERGDEQPSHPLCAKENRLVLGAYIVTGTCFAAAFGTLISVAFLPGINKSVTCCDPCTASYKMGGANSLFYCAQNGTGGNASSTIEHCPFHAGRIGSNFVLICSDDQCIEPSFSVSQMANGTLYCDALLDDTDDMPPLVPMSTGVPEK